MKKFTGTRNITDLMALIVLALFAVSILSLLLAGAEVYRDLVRSGEESHASRTAARYLTTRVRQADRLGVGTFDGCDALLLTEEIDGETYLTQIYCYDGWLRELFAEENGAFSPEDGETILPMQQLSVQLDAPLLRIQFSTAEETMQQLILLLRNPREGSS